MESNTDRVEAHLRELAASAAVGSRLPSVRQLTERFRASSTTVNAAIARLAHEGLLAPRPGSGTFVAGSPRLSPRDFSWQSVTLGARLQPGSALAPLAATPPAGAISLSHGYPDALLQPRDLAQRAARRAVADPRAWERAPSAGLPELRAWFAADAGPGVDADDVLVVPGGQAGLSVVIRALTSPGDAIVVESPTYLGVLEAARQARLTIVPVPTDHAGVQPELLAAAFHESGAKLAVLQPRFANPTGASLARSRRAAVLEVVRAARAFLLEDDYARDLGYPGTEHEPPLLADDADGHVIYLRSLTKPIAPSLRVAALVARGPVLTRLRHGRLVDDLFVSGLLQVVALEVVTSAAWRRSLATLQAGLAERMQTAIAAVADLPVTVPAAPRGGVSLWVQLPGWLDDVTLVDAAARLGVSLMPGRPWFPGEPTGSFLRISVAAAERDAIVAGIDRLATSTIFDAPPAD